MALPFQSSIGKKRTHVVVIDMGQRTTKAVYIQRKGQQFELLQYAVQDAPVYEKGLSPELLAEHLKSVAQALGVKTKPVVFAAGVHDCVLRHAELPFMPVADMRLMLKYNSKNYLQQDLQDYIFDCYIVPPRVGAPAPEVGKNQKCTVLVGGARRQLLEDLQTAAKNAGFIADQVTPGLVGTANAFELAEPEAFAKEVVALVDIGFRNSTIVILMNGELCLSRVVGIGGDKLTTGLADAMSVSYAEAEGIKIGMPEEVQGIMQALLSPLGRELRASIDFFEHQHDKVVTQVFLSGGSARSQFIIEGLQSELMVPCNVWNLLNFLSLALPPQQMGEVEQIAPQLAVAAGGAISAF
jgi:type IV pilus assembly protein PilM